jgi:hypothetical protein
MPEIIFFVLGILTGFGDGEQECALRFKLVFNS